jgi:hypothetical protein
MAKPTTTHGMNPFRKSSAGMTARIRSRMLLHMFFLVLLLIIATVTSLHP